MCQSHHINLLAFSGTFSRAKPLTSYKNKSIEFFRLPLLCYYFSVKILGNCTWKLWATPCLLQTDRCHLSSQTTPFSLFLCHVLQHTCCYSCTPGVLIPSQISSYFSTEIYVSALHKFMRAGNSHLASLGSAGPSPPLSHRWQSSGFAGRLWGSCLVASRTGTIDPGPVLALHFASPAARSPVVFIFHRHLAKEKQPCTSQTF